MLSTRPARNDLDEIRSTPPGASGPSDAKVPSTWAAALAGIVAAACAVATGELVSVALGAEQSLVTSIGNEFIDRFAARLKELAVELFGQNDKVALVTGIVVVSLAFGAALGVASRRWRPAVPLGFGLFGLLGAWAMATDPLGSWRDAVLSAAAAAAAGVVVFGLLWRLSTRRSEEGRAVAGERRDGEVAAGPAFPMAGVTVEVVDGGHRRTIVDRRAFLATSAAALVLAGGASVVARRVRSERTIESVRRSTVLPRPRSSTLPPASQPFEVDGLTPYTTPTADFYRIDTALFVPQVDASGWTLTIDGLVDRPLAFGYDELLEFESVEETVTIQCVSNEVGGSLIGNAVWQGVPLQSLLERVGVDARATQIVGHSVDGFTAGFPTAAIEGNTALVAYAMNGEPLSAKHGYPARLIVAGLYGYVSATKWIERIELTTWEDFDGYWISRGWSKEGPIKTASRIDVPRAGTELSAGRQAIAGVAWAPTRGISGVEVSVDEGPWMPAELGRTASDETWVQWYLPWDATPGEHEIAARATDGDGETQTAEISSPAPDGATGYPRRRVTVV